MRRPLSLLTAVLFAAAVTGCARGSSHATLRIHGDRLTAPTPADRPIPRETADYLEHMP